MEQEERSKTKADQGWSKKKGAKPRRIKDGARMNSRHQASSPPNPDRQSVTKNQLVSPSSALFQPDKLLFSNREGIFPHSILWNE
ncbi:hypothetical protein [Alkalicoccobacillus plakortidis]|uniref:Uncharacterized protein n=1 Tax=Alkalicoccobacillus plakortidis TaxID=444060 RepID=A0ABT0XIN4_9BACI|nr:hypothetical protein [Alkalicoccobacillus plakortidis]MCM2675767.1 hypothetical protein [Alkalicoccobacillus plakortidis]